jgi:hypothetical protein
MTTAVPVVAPVPQPARVVGPNIAVPQLEGLSWKSEAQVETSIHTLYQYVEARSHETIGWYARAKRSKARWSRALRLSAILLTTLGGLAPVINSLGWATGELQARIGQVGYLLLGLAAACVGMDKFFGLSSGWMRYITSLLAQQRSLSEFRLDWAMMTAKLGEKSPTTDQVQLMLQRLKEFLVVVDAEVEQETKAWIAEFQSSIAEIDRTVKTQAEASRPGAIDITVTNGMDAADGFTVSLDGMVVRTVHGTKYQIGYVPPGPHKVAVTGTIGKKQLDASELVNVGPGVIAKVTLALPVEEAQP